MAAPKVLYISQEITPYLPSTPMSDLCRNLPQRIQEKGFEVRIFMPKYGRINERRNQLHEVIRLSGLNLIIDDTDHPLIIKVATLQPARMQVYFIDNDDYFFHNAVTDLEINLHPDENDERAMFFARGVVETVKKLRWEPSIVHCSGWISALAPLYLKHIYNDDPSFRASKVVYSLFDTGFDAPFDSRFVEKLEADGIDREKIGSLVSSDGIVDFVALNKLAIDHSDAVVQASEHVVPELVEYAKSSGKPFMAYSSDETGAEHAEFYNSILSA